MTLITCPECGKEVSNVAEVCIHCGYPIEKMKHINNEMKCPFCGEGNHYQAEYCRKCHMQLNSNDKKDKYIENFNEFTNFNKEKFYKKTPFIIFLLWLVPPIGLILMWIYKKPKNQVLRILITLMCMFYFLLWYNQIISYSNINKIIQQNGVVNETENKEEANKEEAIQDINEITVSKEEYIASCREPNYSEFLRDEDQFKGTQVVLLVQLNQSIISEGITYYQAYTTSDGSYFLEDEWVINDKRIENTTKLLNSDYLLIYGNYVGTDEVMQKLTYSTVSLPAIDMLYCQIFTEAEAKQWYVDKKESQIPTLKQGETWTVDGEWTLTIDSVVTTSERDEYSAINPTQVVIITYSYENLGFNSEPLAFSGYEFIISDEKGEAVSAYYIYQKELKESEYITANSKCSGVQELYALTNESKILHIRVDKYDSNYEKYSCKFDIDISE